jgi:hypothetical protein
MTTKMDQLKTNRDRYRRRLEDIKADPDITAEAKARRLRPIYEEAKAIETRLLGEIRDELKKRVRSAEKEAFAPSNPFGSDPALAMMSARDAFERAARTTDQRELEGMLERAELLGDKTLKRAVAWRANELQAEGVVRRYLDSDEAARKSYETWVEAYGELEKVESFGDELGLGYASIEEPAELSARSFAATQGAGAA